MSGSVCVCVSVGESGHLHPFFQFANLDTIYLPLSLSLSLCVRRCQCVPVCVCVCVCAYGCIYIYFIHSNVSIPSMAVRFYYLRRHTLNLISFFGKADC